VLSLIVWLLVLVVPIKYIVFIMRATTAAKAAPRAHGAHSPTGATHDRSRRRGLLVVLGLFGAALLYATESSRRRFSVLSAVEGLGVATPAFRDYVVPISLTILFASSPSSGSEPGRVASCSARSWPCGSRPSPRSDQTKSFARHDLRGPQPWHGVAFFARTGTSPFSRSAAVVLR